MFYYLPLRTYVLPLLIIGSIFSLKGQEAPEEQPIKRYKGFKLEWGLLTRLSYYDESPADIVNPLEGRDIGEGIVEIGETIGRFGWGIIHLAPQYYIHNNISVGLQYEFDFALYNAAHIFTATGDYYLGNGVIRPALGLALGLNFHKQRNFDKLGKEITDSLMDITTELGREVEIEVEEDLEPETLTALVISPRFKLHLDSFILHLSYDINIGEEVPNGVRLGVASTLFGRKK